MRVYAFRLKPGEDLKKEIIRFVNENDINSGIIMTCVGSLRTAALRLADENISVVFNDKFEIVSLVGTLSRDGMHLHISISDSEGKTIGGHLLDGCIIYTTAEIVIGEMENMIFFREYDNSTGFKELKITNV